MRKLLTLAVGAVAMLMLAPATLLAKNDGSNGNGASALAGNPHQPGATGNPHQAGTNGNPHQNGPPGNPGHATGNSARSGGGASSAPVTASAVRAPDNGNGNGVGNGNGNGPGENSGHAGKTTICHHTGSATNPYVLITISDNAIPAHVKHGDLLPGPSGTCTDATVPLTDSNQPDQSQSGSHSGSRSGGSGTGNTPGSGVGGESAFSDAPVASEPADSAHESSGGELPFTGLELWGLALVGLVACGLGFVLRLISEAREL
jgi:hypothetical protein